MFNRKSIFIKLFLNSIVILLLSFVIFGLIFNYLLHNVFFKTYQDTINAQRDQITEFINMASEKKLEQEIIDSSLSLIMNQEYQTAFIFDSNGKTAYSFDPSNEIQGLIKPEIVDKALIKQEISIKMDVNEHRIFILASPMEIASAEDPQHAFVVVSHGFDQDVGQIRYLNLIAIFVTITVAGIIIFFVSRKITAPLRELNDNVLQFAKGDFSQKVTINRKDEIGQLGKSVNYMAEELASIEQMRKDFVANVSHDLRSPLTSIKGFLVALLDGTIPDAKRNHYVIIMKNETERLIKLVNDLLDLSQLESNQLSITPERYNLSEQLRLVIAKMEPEMMKHQVEVELSGEVEDDIHVRADSDRIEQVLINLLHNAVHFSKKGGRVEAYIRKRDGQAFITVKDFGKGISEEDLTQIWERFYKADRARSGKRGTGIGLSIVKQILDLHQVSINVTSKINEGTEFTFSLPLAKKGS